MKKALLWGILGSLFFAFTFIFNRSMNLSGGYWLWSACLRYIFTLPIMFLMVLKQKNLGSVMASIKKEPGIWLLWSTVGFGLFYGPLTMASIYGESWFVAATWQITIIAGVLLTPLFNHKLPIRNLMVSGIIIIGVILLQIQHTGDELGAGLIKALGLILLAAFAYPLGNRKMMVQCEEEELTTIQRMFGMTLMSMPFWLVLSGVAFVNAGLPSGGQVMQSVVVALFSGVVATVLFFEATNLVKDNPKQLAVIEATQSGEVIFTLIGGCLFLGDKMPSTIGFIGIVIIIVGMIGNSLISAKN